MRFYDTYLCLVETKMAKALNNGCLQKIKAAFCAVRNAALIFLPICLQSIVCLSCLSGCGLPPHTFPN